MRMRKIPGLVTRFIGFGLVMGLVACGPAPLPPGDAIVDREETRNRAIHDFNLSLDRAVVGPAAEGFGDAVPEPVREGVSNFASNLNQPGYVLNNLLQFRLGQASHNSIRFLINSTLGVGGLFDVAAEIGIHPEPTDFGETLHIYGVPEGDFVMHPILGPSTSRDTVGMIVDFAINPVRHLAGPPESYVLIGAGAAAGLDSRDRFDDTLDSILYESADSYAQLRSLYLQQRRYELGGGGAASYEDPYADPYADPTSGAITDAPDPLADPYYDPYSDPYYDPYAQ